MNEIETAFKEIEDYCLDEKTPFVDFDKPVWVDNSGILIIPKKLWDALKELCLSPKPAQEKTT